MGEMTEAFIRQLEEHNKSMYVDRTDWTRQQWIDDANELMDHPDGAITSLCNGHVMALLSGIEALQGKLDATQTELARVLLLLDPPIEPINIIFDGPPSAVSGRFLEVELDDGSGVNVGEWIKRSGRGTWALRVTELPRKKG